jgi:quercetin dioxygenase-like cupin family protein
MRAAASFPTLNIGAGSIRRDRRACAGTMARRAGATAKERRMFAQTVQTAKSAVSSADLDAERASLRGGLILPSSPGNRAVTGKGTVAVSRLRRPVGRVVAIAAVVLLLGVLPARLFAQSATPMASPAMQSVTVEMLGSGMPNNAPGLSLELQRVTLQPGAAVPNHVHPGAYVITVQSGQFGFTVVKGEVQFTKAGSTTPQTISAGTDVIGQAGDTFFEQGGVVHSARNAGSTPTVVLAAALLDPRMPFLMPTNDQGTPTM